MLNEHALFCYYILKNIVGEVKTFSKGFFLFYRGLQGLENKVVKPLIKINNYRPPVVVINAKI